MGWFCPGGEASPRMCQDGFVALSAGMSHCEPCPLGHFCPRPTDGKPVIQVEPCAVGYYQDELGQTSCKKCPSGHWCEVTGLITGSFCHGGQYLQPGGSTCIDCPGGFICPAGEGIKSCDKGTYAEKGSVECLACPAGHYCPKETGDPIPCNDPTKCEGGNKKNKGL